MLSPETRIRREPVSRLSFDIDRASARSGFLMRGSLSPAQIANQITFRLKGDLKNAQIAYIRAAQLLARVATRSSGRRCDSRRSRSTPPSACSFSVRPSITICRSTTGSAGFIPRGSRKGRKASSRSHRSVGADVDRPLLGKGERARGAAEKGAGRCADGPGVPRASRPAARSSALVPSSESREAAFPCGFPSPGAWTMGPTRRGRSSRRAVAVAEEWPRECRL